MNTFDEIKPMLTEPGVKYFINETLKQKIKEFYQENSIDLLD